MDKTIQRGCDVFLFLMSPGSLGSQKCLSELNTARQTGIPIIPVLLRDCVIPGDMRDILFPDFREAPDLPFYLVDLLVEGIRKQAEEKQNRADETEASAQPDHTRIKQIREIPEPIRRTIAQKSGRKMPKAKCQECGKEATCYYRDAGGISFEDIYTRVCSHCNSITSSGYHAGEDIGGTSIVTKCPFCSKGPFAHSITPEKYWGTPVSWAN